MAIEKVRTENKLTQWERNGVRLAGERMRLDMRGMTMLAAAEQMRKIIGSRNIGDKNRLALRGLIAAGNRGLINTVVPNPNKTIFALRKLGFRIRTEVRYVLMDGLDEGQRKA